MGCSHEAAGYRCMILFVRLMAVAVGVSAHSWGSLAATPTTHQTIQVNTRLVVVNIVAHNKQGEPVKDLAQRDFTILDNGKPQQISVFSVERTQSRHVPSKPLPPNVFSNRVAREGNVPVNLAVILLDGMDTSFADSVFARNEVIKFLKQVPPGERVALYVLGPGTLSVIQDFTSDPSPLLEAIRGYHSYAGEEPNVPTGAASFGMPSMSERDAADRIEADMKYLRVSARAGNPPIVPGIAISQIALHLSGLPGRKSLIWVTDRVLSPGPERLSNLGAMFGYEGNLRAQEHSINTLIRILNQGDVAVYPIDAHGLVVGPTKTGAVHGPDLTPLWAGETWTLAMDYWAQQTGGRAFHYTNDLRQAIGNALDDTKVVYTLGYYPDDVAWNGEFRNIKVLVDRKDVRLRYRRGYYATAATTNAFANPASRLESAASRPLDSTGIGITVEITPVGKLTSHQFKAAVYVDGDGLTFQPENGHYETSFMVWAGQYSREGSLLEARSRKASFKLNESNYHSALAGGLGVTLHEKAHLRASELRVAVLDMASGSTGSVRIPLSSMPGPEPRNK